MFHMVKQVGALRRAMETENIIPAHQAPQSSLDVLASAQPILAQFGAFSPSNDAFRATPAQVCDITVCTKSLVAHCAGEPRAMVGCRSSFLVSEQECTRAKKANVQR